MRERRKQERMRERKEARKDEGKEGSKKGGSRKGGMQETMDAGNERRRKEWVQIKRETGNEGNER